MHDKPLDLGPHLQCLIGAEGIAELVFGPEGGMPFTDARGHAELATIWQRLQAEPGVRVILVRSVGKGFCAGGTPEVVQGMLDSEAARLRVMHEARAIVQGMVDCDLPIVSAINGTAVGAGAAVALLADVSIAGLNHWLRAAWPAFEHSLALEVLGFAGADAREGFAALNERRPARFGVA